MDQSIANMCIKNIDNTWWTINGCCIWKWVCIVSLCVDGDLRMCLDVFGVVDRSNGKSDISKWKRLWICVFYCNWTRHLKIKQTDGLVEYD
jgi:hypothetical protein